MKGFAHCKGSTFIQHENGCLSGQPFYFREITYASFGDEKKYHPKGKGAVITGAAAAIIPVILIIIVIMFICALFAWASPHKGRKA